MIRTSPTRHITTEIASLPHVSFSLYEKLHLPKKNLDFRPQGVTNVPASRREKPIQTHRVRIKEIRSACKEIRSAYKKCVPSGRDGISEWEIHGYSHFTQTWVSSRRDHCAPATQEILALHPRDTRAFPVGDPSFHRTRESLPLLPRIQTSSSDNSPW